MPDFTGTSHSSATIPARTASHPTRLARTDGTPLRVLIVEDEYLTRLQLEQTLQELCAEVIATTGHGAMAIVLSELHRPDVVLMDIRIDGSMDGIEAARWILDRLAIPVVFVSGYNDAMMRACIAGLSGPELVVKPIVGEQLEAAIRRACEP
ncbi:MAG TPA: response regulator [Alphaproteobacteria bacterium]